MQPDRQLASSFNTALFLLRVASAAAFLYHGSAILLVGLMAPAPQRLPVLITGRS